MSHHSPATRGWRYNEVTFKASHNSYLRSERPVVTQLAHSSAQPHQGGCRGLELDLHLSGDLWEWSISHIGPYEGSTDRQFGAYLRLLDRWSARSPGHDVITISLDLKGKPHDLRAFPYYLDEYIRTHMGEERIFAPDALRGSHDSLVAGAMKNGWPSLDELRGKFILCLSGNEKSKTRYAAGRGRLCFADRKLSFDDVKKKKPDDKRGDRVFFNFDLDPIRPWKTQLERFFRRRGFVTRGYTLNDGVIWNKAIEWKVNLLATDKVRNHSWATVGPHPFKKL